MQAKIWTQYSMKVFYINNKISHDMHLKVYISNLPLDSCDLLYSNSPSNKNKKKIKTNLLIFSKVDLCMTSISVWTSMTEQ